MPPHRPVIIDCDPGQDDAVMLLMALAWRDRLDILGITTVAGNVPLDLTQRNARLICELAGVTDVPVYAGCDAPLERDLYTAEHVHGQTGIDGLPIHEPTVPLQDTHAVDFIIETLLAAPDNSVTLVPTGPLTNIATALRRAPTIRPRIREIVLMGGASREGGNSTPSAEFNIFVDPQAAEIVLNCGRPLTVAGLDVTHQVMVEATWLAALRERAHPVATATADMLECFNRFDADKYGSEGAPLHDPCTIAWLLEPELFEHRHCNIEVETHSELTMGHTAVDFWHVTARPRNARWLHRVDRDGFFDLLDRSLDRHAA